MSNKIKFTKIAGKGCGVLASSPIKKNEVILTESPLVAAQFSWNKEYGYLACDHCMLPLESYQQNVQRLAQDKNIILPCQEIPELADQEAIVNCNSCGAFYCSSKCASTAYALYHSFECNQYKLGGRFHEIIELWKKCHYPPESFSVVLIIRIFGMIKNMTCPDLFELLDGFSKHSVNEDLQICHKMLGEKFRVQLSEVYEAMQKVFGGDEQLEKYMSHDGFISLLAILGTNSQGIGTSSFANWVQSVSDMEMAETKRNEIDEFIDAIYTRFNDTVGSFLDNEASGLYIMQSKCNHSCVPNAQIMFPSSNFTLNVVALRDISPEEEICISYIDECMLSRSRHSRQKYLQENYVFKCECEKCESQHEDPDQTSDEEIDMETDDDDEEN